MALGVISALLLAAIVVVTVLLASYDEPVADSSGAPASGPLEP